MSVFFIRQLERVALSGFLGLPKAGLDGGEGDLGQLDLDGRWYLGPKGGHVLHVRGGEQGGSNGGGGARASGSRP